MSVKPFFYRVTQDDLTFDPDSGQHRTAVVDLYDNEVYTNYTLATSTYGYSGFDRQWIGLRHPDGALLTREEIENPTGTFETDSGRYVNGRFIDTSGRIDLITLYVPTGQSPSYHLYNSDLDDATSIDDEWSHAGPFSMGDDELVIGAYRNLVIGFDFGGVAPDEFEALLSISIDRPVMAPRYQSTRKMMNRFPQWMSLHGDAEESTDLATPDTVGGKVINALSGEWIDEITREINKRDAERFISTVDVSQRAWTFTSPVEDAIWSIQGDGVDLIQVHHHDDLLSLPDGSDAVYIDYADDILYATDEYDELTVNGEAVEQSFFQEWNYVDELGTYVDLERLYREDNESYRLRILDVYKNPGGAGVRSFKNALRRELNLWAEYGEEIDSDFEGATPTLVEMTDVIEDPKYFTPEGLPTEIFVQLVEQLAKDYPTTWGNFVWDRALWDIAGPDNEGYGLLPYRYDQDQPSSNQLKSGVGDGDDLFVFEPGVVTGPQNSDVNLVARGRQSSIRVEYRPAEMDITVQGRGTEDVYSHPLKQVWVSLLVETTSDGPYVASFLMQARSDATESGVATPDSYDRIEAFSEAGTGTHESLVFVDPDTGDAYWSEAAGHINPHPDGGAPSYLLYPPGFIPFSEMVSMKIVQGRYVAGELQQTETQDHYKIWFSHDPGTVAQLGVAEGSLPQVTTAEAEQDLPEVVMESLLQDPVSAVEWLTPEVPTRVVMNETPPYDEPQSATIEVPSLYFPSSVYDRDLLVKVKTTDPFSSTLRYGAVSSDASGNDKFVLLENIAANGSTSWSEDGEMAFATGTQTLEFSIEPTYWGSGEPMLVELADGEKAVWFGSEPDNYVEIRDVNLLDTRQASFDNVAFSDAVNPEDRYEVEGSGGGTGDTRTSDSPMLVDLEEMGSEKVAWFGGEDGNFLRSSHRLLWPETPQNVVVQVRAQARLGYAGHGDMTFISDYDDANRSMSLLWYAGEFYFAVVDNAGSISTATWDLADLTGAGFSEFEGLTLRVTWDNTANTVVLESSRDKEPASWTQLGATKSFSATNRTMQQDPSTAPCIGCDPRGVDAFDGAIAYVRVFADDKVISNFDAEHFAEIQDEASSSYNAVTAEDYASFARSSTAYYDGVRYEAGEPRYVRGSDSLDSLLLEDGTENLATTQLAGSDITIASDDETLHWGDTGPSRLLTPSAVPDAEFSRSSPAWTPDGVRVGVDEPRYVWSRHPDLSSDLTEWGRHTSSTASVETVSSGVFRVITEANTAAVYTWRPNVFTPDPGVVFYVLSFEAQYEQGGQIFGSHFPSGTGFYIRVDNGDWAYQTHVVVPDDGAWHRVDQAYHVEGWSHGDVYAGLWICPGRFETGYSSSLIRDARVYSVHDDVLPNEPIDTGLLLEPAATNLHDQTLVGDLGTTVATQAGEGWQEGGDALRLTPGTPDPATFTRASRAYLDGVVHEADEPRFTDDGLLLEPGTTNVLPNPAATALDGFAQTGNLTGEHVASYEALDVTARTVGAPSANKPMLVSPRRWGVDQVLYLPGGGGGTNSANVKDTNLLPNVLAHPCSWVQSGSVTTSPSDQRWFHLYGNRGHGTIDPNEPSPAGLGAVKTDASSNGDTRFAYGPIYDFDVGTYTVLMYVKRSSGTWYSSPPQFSITSSGVAVENLATWSETATGAEDAGDGWSLVWTTFNVTASGWARLQAFNSGGNSAATTEEVWIGGACLRADAVAEFAPSLNLNRDFEVTVDVASHDWETVDGIFRRLVGREDSGSDASSFMCFLLDGTLGFRIDDANDVRTSMWQVRSGAHGLSDGARALLTFRCEWDGPDATLTILVDDVLLATAVVTPDVDSLQFSRKNLAIGSTSNGSGNHQCAVFSVTYRDGIDGPIVASVDFTNTDEVTGDTWTTPEGLPGEVVRGGVDATAELVQRSVWALFSQSLTIPHDERFENTDLHDGIGLFALVATRQVPSVNGLLFGKASPSGGTTPGWGIYHSAGTTSFRLTLADGDAEIQRHTTAGINDGMHRRVVASLDRVGGTTYIDVDGVQASGGGANGVEGSTANGLDVMVGAYPGGSYSGDGNGLYSALVMAHRPWTAAERAELGAWDGSVATEPEWLRDAAALYLNADDPTTWEAYDDDVVVNLGGKALNAATVVSEIGTNPAVIPMLVSPRRHGLKQAVYLPGTGLNFVEILQSNNLPPRIGNIDSGQASDWTGFGSQATFSKELEPSSPYGDYVIRLTRTGDASTLVRAQPHNDYSVAVTAGTVYTFSAWMRSVTSPSKLKMSVTWRDGNNDFLSEGGAPQSSTEVLNSVVGDWYYVSTAIQAPAGAFRAFPQIQFYSNSNGNPVQQVGDQYEFAAVSMSTNDVVATDAFTPAIVPRGKEWTFDWRAEVLINDWAAISTGGIVSTSSYPRMTLGVGKKISLAFKEGGFYKGGLNSTVLPYDEGEFFAVRVVATRNTNGTVDADFYHAPSIDDSWVAIGSSSITVNPDDGESHIRVGSRDGSNHWQGMVKKLEVYDGEDGTLVVSADFTDSNDVSDRTWTTPQGLAGALASYSNPESRIELIKNSCFAFNGLAQQLALPHKDVYNTDDGNFTVEVMSQFMTDNEIQPLVQKISFTNAGATGHASWRLRANHVSGMEFSMYSAPAYSGITVPAHPQGESFSTISMLDFDTRTVQTYFDGVLQGQAAMPADMDGTTNNTSSLYIGRNVIGGTYYLGGLIYRVCLFKRLLTDEERTELAAWDGSVAKEPRWLRQSTFLYVNADDPVTWEAYDNNHLVDLSTLLTPDNKKVYIAGDGVKRAQLEAGNHATSWQNPDDGPREAEAAAPSISVVDGRSPGTVALWVQPQPVVLDDPVTWPVAKFPMGNIGNRVIEPSNDSGNMVWRVGSGGITVSVGSMGHSPLDTERPSLLVITWDEDGVPSFSCNGSALVSKSGVNFALRDAQTREPGWSFLDEVHLRGMLTNQQITDLYAAGPGFDVAMLGVTDDVVARYRLDDSLGSDPAGFARAVRAITVTNTEEYAGQARVTSPAGAILRLGTSSAEVAAGTDVRAALEGHVAYGTSETFMVESVDTQPIDVSAMQVEAERITSWQDPADGTRVAEGMTGSAAVIDGRDEGTIALWIDVHAASHSSIVEYVGNGRLQFELHDVDGVQWRYRLRCNDTLSGASDYLYGPVVVDPTGLHFLVVTYDNDGTMLYVDDWTDSSAVPAQYDTPSNAAFPRWNKDGDLDFVLLDEVHLRRALTDVEVAALRAAGPGADLAAVLGEIE